ncbi:MAG: YybH family protein [Phycisphaerae bacterium]
MIKRGYGLSGALLVLIAPLVGCQSPVRSAEADIRRVLDRQVADWNRGDIPAFMSGYWESTELTMYGSQAPRVGWMTLLKSYQSRYPDRAAMGTLTFKNLKIRALGDSAALALGIWRVERASGPIGGYFTVILEHIDGKWVITHDHTSSVEPAP